LTRPQSLSLGSLHLYFLVYWLSSSERALEFSGKLVDPVLRLIRVLGPRVDGDALPRDGADGVRVVRDDVADPDLKHDPSIRSAI